MWSTAREGNEFTVMHIKVVAVVANLICGEPLCGLNIFLLKASTQAKSFTLQWIRKTSLGNVTDSSPPSETNQTTVTAS